MTQIYTVSHVKQYMRKKLEEGNHRDRLFEFEFQDSCREAMRSLPFSRNSGRGLLFSFASISGGWETKVGRLSLDNSDDCLGVSDDFQELARTDLSIVAEAGEKHPHRHIYGTMPDRPLNYLDRMEVLENSVNSMSEIFDLLEDYHESQSPNIGDTANPNYESAFDLALDVFEDVNTFSTLTAFDFLECAIRVNEQEWLSPPRLKVAHVNRNGPGEALERIVADEGANVNLTESEKAQEVLDELSAFVRDDLGLGHEAAIFDVETCLCVYHGELEDEGPGRRGSCT